MNYEIVELVELTGNNCTIYSIIEQGDDETLFDKFLVMNSAIYPEEIKDIVKTLKIIGKKTGARVNFFKHEEGKPGDGVCNLFDLPDNKLRLFCIRYGMNIIILGDGAHKAKSIRKWQQDPTLNKIGNQMIGIADDILRRIKCKELIWSKDGMSLEGDLKNYEDE